MASSIFTKGGGAGIGSYILVFRNGVLSPDTDFAKVRGAYDSGDTIYFSIIDEQSSEALISTTGWVGVNNELHLIARDFDDNKTYSIVIEENGHFEDADIRIEDGIDLDGKIVSSDIEIEGNSLNVSEPKEPGVLPEYVDSIKQGDAIIPIHDPRLEEALAEKADLVDGKVPASQLPSYVDDVVEYPSFSDFPNPGESGKIYVALDTNLVYRWGGSEYILISSAASVLEYPSASNFPNPGQAGVIYIADDENRQYRWDANASAYEQLSQEDEIAIVAYQTADPLNDIQMRKAAEGKLYINAFYGEHFAFPLGETATDYVFEMVYSTTSTYTDEVVRENSLQQRIYHLGKQSRLLSISEDYITRSVAATEDNFLPFGADPLQNGKRLIREANVVGKLIPSYTALDADKLVKINASGTGVEFGTISALLTAETTWAELKARRDAGQLVPGMWYRITDYQFTTVTPNTSVGQGAFDLLVFADSASSINEEARAVAHAGDAYFASCDLGAWKIWYDLDNDASLYGWADETNGKGVIFRMIDEYGNDCPYDFKHCLFSKDGVYDSVYTFSYDDRWDTSVGDYTAVDASLYKDKRCENNVMVRGANYETGKYELPFNVILGKQGRVFSSYDNLFGPGSSDNLLRDSCQGNRLAGLCVGNVIGSHCSGNTLENQVVGNVIGDYCVRNAIGDDYNVLGDYCQENRINGIECVLGEHCSRNALEWGCEYVEMGDYCEYCSFLGGNISVTLGEASGVADYCSNIIVDPGCSYAYVTSADTEASEANKLQNVRVCAGVRGLSESGRKTLTVPDRNLAYETAFKANGTEEIII